MLASSTLNATRSTVLAAAFATVAVLSAGPAHAGFVLGTAANYAVLIESGAGNFQLTSDSGVDGNVGIGSPIAGVQLAGGTIDGDLDFSGAEPSGAPNYGGTITGSVNQNVSAVATALTTINSLNSNLGAEAGTTLAISGAGQTINVSSGILDGNGNDVFTVGSNNFNLAGGITINGNANQYVVINIDNGTSNEALNGGVKLMGGITSDHVLFNFVGSSGNLGAAANNAIAMGIFLAPDMKLNIDSITIDGRLFGGRPGNDFQIVSNAYINAPQNQQVPEPASLALLGTALVGLGGAGFVRRRRNSSKA